MASVRVIAASLTVSAAMLVGVAEHEGWAPVATIPTKGDVPTNGFGSTTREDGTPVQLGDTTTPVRALKRSFAYLQGADKDMKASLDGVMLSQAEYDVYLDWRYQYGPTKWRASSMLRYLKAGNYVAACDALLLYNLSGGYDCSTPDNKICAGVWTRQLERHKQCMAAQ